MPRKRRRFPKKRALPMGLAAISKCERALWASSGPLIAANGDTAPAGYSLWLDWRTWAAFYASVRDELDPRPTSMAEAIFAAMQAGDDPEDARRRLLAERRAEDPRRLLCRG